MTGTTSRSVTALLTVIVLVAGCSTSSTSPSPSPAAAGPTSPLATLAPPSAAPLTPAPAAEPTDAQTPEPLVIGGTWLRPKASATLTSYTTILSAKTTASGDGVTTFTKVVFSATSAGAKKKVMCTATKPADSGDWTCKANLLAMGVPPGKVTFSFDVYGEGVPVARSPAGPRRVTYAVVPPRPANTRWEQVQAPNFDSGDNTAIYRLRWSAPAGYADEFLVYETHECPRENTGTPCFVAGTPVGASQLERVARVPGDARSVKVRLTEHDCDGHGTILLRARNAYGRSVFAIVETFIWNSPGPYENYC